MWFFNQPTSMPPKVTLEQVSRQVELLHQTMNENYQHMLELMCDLNRSVIIQPMLTAPITDDRGPQATFMDELRVKLDQMRINMGESHGFDPNSSINAMETAMMRK